MKKVILLFTVLTLLLMVFLPVYSKNNIESKLLHFKMPEKAGELKSLPVTGPPVIFNLRVGYNSEGDNLYAGCHIINFDNKSVYIDYVVYFYDINGKEVLKGKLSDIEVQQGMQLDNPQELQIATKMDVINSIKSFKVDIKMK